MCLRRGRNVPCANNRSADRLSIGISKRDMVKHDQITRQTHPLRQRCFSNLALELHSEGPDYRLSLTVLYHRTNHISNSLSDGLS